VGVGLVTAPSPPPKPTPGPWKVEKDENGWYVRFPSGGVFPSSERDAKIIALAPELLEALKDLIGPFLQIRHRERTTNYTIGYCDEIEAKVLALLARAEGKAEGGT
jgi:hypothetical protein